MDLRRSDAMRSEWATQIDATLADVLPGLVRDWHLDAHALARGYDASWSVGGSTHPGYDDPAMAIWYASWWHPQRVNTALPLARRVVERLRGDGGRVLDIGAGTGAFAWALQLAMHESGRRRARPIELILTDASTPMLRVAMAAWPVFEANCRRDGQAIGVKLVDVKCAEWDAPSLALQAPSNLDWIVASYLVAHEDGHDDRLRRFEMGLSRLSRASRAHIGLISSRAKKETVSRIASLASAATKKGIEALPAPDSVSTLCTRLHEVRRQWHRMACDGNSRPVKPFFDSRRPEFDGYPSWGCTVHGAAGFAGNDFESTAAAARFDVEWGAAQQAVIDSPGSTLVHGAAGTGKTLVVAHKAGEEFRRGSEGRLGFDSKPQILFLVFNQHMVDVVAMHLEDATGLRAVRDGKLRVDLMDTDGERCIRLQTWYTFMGDQYHQLSSDCGSTDCHCGFKGWNTRTYHNRSRLPASEACPPGLERLLKQHGYSYDEFVLEELQATIHGFDCQSQEEYEAMNRKGRGAPALRRGYRSAIWRRSRSWLTRIHTQFLAGPKREGDIQSDDVASKGSRFFAAQLALEAWVYKNGVPAESKFDWIFIDEGQDFSRASVRLACEYLLPQKSERGGIVVAVDPNQSIMKSTVFAVPGRPRLSHHRLEHSYRIPEFLEAGLKRLQLHLSSKWADLKVLDEEELDSEVRAAEASEAGDRQSLFRRLGSRLVIMAARNEEGLLRKLAALQAVIPPGVEDSLEGGVAGVGLLGRHSDIIDATAVAESLFPLDDGVECRATPPVEHCELLKCKGLEWPGVIVKSWNLSSDVARPEELLYVSLSRATRLSVLLIVGEKPLSPEIQDAIHLLNFENCLMWDLESEDIVESLFSKHGE